jgi:hypothetical protein
MTREQRFTGWEVEAQIKRLLENAPPGKSYCALCLAEMFGISTAPGYVDVARALGASARTSQIATIPFKANA